MYKEADLDRMCTLPSVWRMTATPYRSMRKCGHAKQTLVRGEWRCVDCGIPCETIGVSAVEVSHRI